MKRTVSSSLQNQIMKYPKLYAFLKTGAFFIGSAAIVGALSFAVTCPLWFFSEIDNDLFAVCTGIIALFADTIFFTLRLIRSIKEMRADDFFTKLFKRIYFILFLAIHAAVAVLYAQLFAVADITDTPPAVFFYGILFMQAGALFSNFNAHRIGLYSGTSFIVYSILSVLHFVFWCFVLLARGYFLQTGFQCIIILSAGVLIYARLRKPKKPAAD